MKQEDKNLVKQYVCMSIPFGLKAQIKLDNEIFIGTIYGVDENSVIYVREGNDYKEDTEFEDIKPYLRPMSSMTKEDKEELAAVLGVDYIDNKVVDFGEFLCEGSPVNIEDVYGLLDWLNAHHFDYRGLIGRNLAISTEVFNPYKD